MKTTSTLTGFLKESPFRGAQLGAAVILLVVVSLFLLIEITIPEGGLSSEATTGSLWVGAAASVILPVLIVAHTAYDVIGWLWSSNRSENQLSNRSMIDLVFRGVELGLSAIILVVVGVFGSLVTTQPGGQGAGGIAIGVVLVVAVVGILLSITVLAQGVVRHIMSGLE